MKNPFLTARWESLVLLNYKCPRDLLAPLVPAGTELDEWKGDCLVSLVGFLFLDTRVRGIRIPFHVNFEEVNLRFYVRREAADGLRRGVVFVRELVPRRAISTVARLLYNEPYRTASMDHEIDLSPDAGGRVKYQWRYRGAPYSLMATAHGAAKPLMPGSDAEFITEHYWGYNRQRTGSTMEYEVRHPPWNVWDCATASFEGANEAEALYGKSFAEVLKQEPVSAHLAVGSQVEVFAGQRLDR